MLGIPSPYLIIFGLVGALALAGGGFFEGRHYESLTWAKALQEQKLDAAAELQSVTAANAATDARNAELANEVDRTHAKAIADIDATRADFSRRLLIASSRKGDSCSTTAQAVNPSVSAPVAARGDDGSGRVDIDAGERLRAAALKLQQYAKVCNAWSLEVGR